MSSCLALRIASNDHFSFFSTAAIHTARLRSHGKGRMRVFRKVGVEIFKCHANRSDVDFKVLSCTAKIFRVVERNKKVYLTMSNKLQHSQKTSPWKYKINVPSELAAKLISKLPSGTEDGMNSMPFGISVASSIPPIIIASSPKCSIPGRAGPSLFPPSKAWLPFIPSVNSMSGSYPSAK